MKNKIKFEDHINMCRKAAWKITKKYYLEYEEVEAQSFLIYAEAIEKFNDKKGTKFSTYLWYRLLILNEYAQKQFNNNQNSSEDLEDFQNTAFAKSYDFELFVEILEFYDSADLILSDDAIRLLAHVLDDYYSKGPSLNSVHLYFKRNFTWKPARVKKAWKEVKSWWETHNMSPVYL